jgi:hypothetical protein
MKKAVKTEAYESLKPRQKDIVNWFLSGEAPKNSWMDSFVFGADSEIENKVTKKATPPKSAPGKGAAPDQELAPEPAAALESTPEPAGEESEPLPSSTEMEM